MISKFKLGAVEWSVEINDHELDLKRCYGECNYSESKVTLQNKSDGKERNTLAVELTLYHEVVHAILYTMGRTQENDDEEFVQTFAALLHQFEKTKE